jgi:hypothetical protein
MKSTHSENRTVSFRSAIEAQDLVRAGQILQELIVQFRSQKTTVQQIEAAQDLFEWAIARTRTQKVRLSEELMLLKRCLDAYAPAQRTHTWRVEG